MRNIIAPFLILLVSVQWCFGQELVRPLDVNPAKSNPEVQHREKTDENQLPLTLPFFEDFSYPGPYPDPKLWADSFAFVNSSFPVHPITVGVATFDALDQHGYIYEDAQENFSHFVADYLTSNPIRLDSVFSPSEAAIVLADSVLLTFYFQPQGRGGAPKEKDSLVVEFLHTPGYFYTDEFGEQVWEEDLWQSVWSSEGQNLEDFSGNTFPYFKRVAIPITDEVYLRNDFRFRFKNYSHFPIPKSLVNYAGNNNIWNVDYITLDRGRSVFNTSYYDIAFASPAGSMLENYTAMPWSHYIINPQSHLKSNFNNLITNLGSITYNYMYQYVIKDETNTNIRTYSGGTWNIAPFSEAGYQNHNAHTSPIVLANPLPTAPAPERTFKIVHSIREGATGDDHPRNDTITYVQEFKNYFAYDDGVPEAGYGLEGFNNPQLAYRFQTSHNDNLEGVQIFFNRTLSDQNVKLFYLTIWSSIDPPEILYESEAITPEFQDGINQFTTYILESPVAVGTTFYVGWRQGNNDFLNVGFDLTNDASTNTFFNVGGAWEQSIQQGALMIRPLTSLPPSTGIQQPRQQLEFEVYPNPVKDNFLNISLDDELASQHHILQLTVYDVQGRVVMSENYSNIINISQMLNGMYFLRVTNPDTGHSGSVRFIIAR